MKRKKSSHFIDPFFSSSIIDILIIFNYEQIFKLLYNDSLGIRNILFYIRISITNRYFVYIWMFLWRLLPKYYTSQFVLHILNCYFQIFTSVYVSHNFFYSQFSPIFSTFLKPKRVVELTYNSQISISWTKSNKIVLLSMFILRKLIITVRKIHKSSVKSSENNIPIIWWSRCRRQSLSVINADWFRRDWRQILIRTSIYNKLMQTDGKMQYTTK